MTTGVYAITHTASGRQYVGASLGVEQRLREHVLQLCRNAHHSREMQELWNTDGETAFDSIVLEECSPDVLADVEARWIRELRPVLNMRSGKNHGGSRAGAGRRGMDPESGRAVRFNLRMPQPMLDDLMDYAAHRHTTVSAVVRRLVAEELERSE